MIYGGVYDAPVMNLSEFSPKRWDGAKRHDWLAGCGFHLKENWQTCSYEAMLGHHKKSHFGATLAACISHHLSELDHIKHLLNTCTSKTRREPLSALFHSCSGWGVGWLCKANHPSHFSPHHCDTLPMDRYSHAFTLATSPGGFSHEWMKEAKGRSGRGRFVNKHMSNCLPLPGRIWEEGRRQGRSTRRRNKREGRKEELSHRLTVLCEEEGHLVSEANVKLREQLQQPFVNLGILIRS